MLPARAEMSPGRARARSGTAGAPRTRGDAPRTFESITQSPRYVDVHSHRVRRLGATRQRAGGLIALAHDPAGGEVITNL